MQYWKYVEIPEIETIKNKLYEYHIRYKHSKFINPNSFWSGLKPEYMKDLSSNISELDHITNIFGPINEIAVLTIDSITESTLHIDHTAGMNAGVKARLNFPILNCDNTLTSFYEMSETIFNLHEIDQYGTKSWPDYFRTYLKPITSVELSKPAILRTSAPHTVFSSKERPRISATISFKDDIVKYL